MHSHLNHKFQVQPQEIYFNKIGPVLLLVCSCRIMLALFLCFRVCLKHRSPGRVSVLCWTVEPLANTAPVLNPFHSLRLIPIMWVLSHIDYCTSRVTLDVPVSILLADIRFPQILEAISHIYIYIKLTEIDDVMLPPLLIIHEIAYVFQLYFVGSP